MADQGTIARSVVAHGAASLPEVEVDSYNIELKDDEGLLGDRVGEHETVILMHNDAVVQGLSETPYMRDVSQWGVLTIGTGLGNACFTNRSASAKD